MPKQETHLVDEPRRNRPSEATFAYLTEMARLGLWGSTAEEVSVSLIEEGIRRAVEKQLIPRKYFP